MKIKPDQLILYIDDSLLVINKPAGLLTLPDGYDPDAPHVVGLLSQEFGNLWIVHRLDKDTSGVLALARTPEAHQILNQQFETRQASKVYHALVRGQPAWVEHTVSLPLLPDGDRRHRTVVDHRQGKPSVTRLRVVERFEKYALVEACPETGRTHQVRVHLARQGLPIVADPLYGDGKGIFLSEIKPEYRKKGAPERPLLGRLGLHACSVEIVHPLAHKPVRFEAPYPKDFSAALKQLRRLP